MKKYVTLGEVCSKGSSNIAQKDIEQNNGSYGIYGASGYIKDVDFYHQDKPYIAVVKDGAGIGRTMLLPAKTSVIGTMQYLIPNDLVSVNYLYYAVTYMNLAKYFTGATIPHIYFKDYQKERLLLPAITEQQRIADNLSKIDKLIELCYSIVDKLDMLVKSRFVEMFGDCVYNDRNWNTETVESVCSEIYGGGTPSKAHSEYYENGNIPWVSSKDMKFDVITESQIYINQLGVDNSTARLVPVNSVIMVIRSGILKHTLPVAINAVPITVNQDLKVFIPNNKILTRFLAIQFKMHEKDILAGVRAVTADNIEFNSLKQRILIVPPIELQEKYVSFIKQVDKSKYSALKIKENIRRVKFYDQF